MAVPDIFDEVKEDLRAERARALAKRFGGALLVALVLVLAAVGGYQAWKQYQDRQIARDAGVFLKAQAEAEGPQPGRAAALPALDSLGKTAGPGYRTLARLREAALKADAGDAAGAGALWDSVSADTSADPLLRDLADLQWSLHQIDAGDPAAVSARLARLAAPANPWHSLALEGQAMLALRQGKTDAARDILKGLAADPTAPEGVRGRAGGLLQRLGS